MVELAEDEPYQKLGAKSAQMDAQEPVASCMASDAMRPKGC